MKKLSALIYLGALLLIFGCAATSNDEKLPGAEVVSAPKAHMPLNETELEKVDAEKHEFKAETDRLMNIIINSLYTEREVFLREMISNAADAIEKVRMSALKDPEMLIGASGKPFEDLQILVKVDKKRNELTIIDTGIGMTKEELINDLGTVARSGTDQFLEAAKRGLSASNLIGQFGVGFYSAFLVADQVTVVSKSPKSPDQWIWRSAADGAFTIGRDPRPTTLERGTVVTIKLKDDATKYAKKYEVSKILKRFSDFVSYPIFLGEVKEDSNDIEWVRTNPSKPIWLRDKSELTDEDYIRFYKNFTGLNEEPIAWTHFKAEGDFEFSGLLYIPTNIRSDVHMGMEKSGSDIKLYVQRVLISDKIPDFLPNWANFMRGVIDSNDLPLKVDRETFSKSRVMRVMKKKALSKTLELFKQLSKEAYAEAPEVQKYMNEHKDDLLKLRSDESFDTKELEEISNRWKAYAKWVKFWDKFSNILTLGCIERNVDIMNKNRILEIFHGRSTKSDLLIPLHDYKKRMKDQQENIYFLTGDNLEVMKHSPYMEFFDAKDIEVFLLLGSYDEACFQTLVQYEGSLFKSIEKDIFDISEFAFLDAGADKKKLESVKESMTREQRARELYYTPLKQWVSDVLGRSHASAVKMSQTLVKSPVKISTPSHGFSAMHERMARTAATVNRLMIDAFSKMKTFELNAEHPLIHWMLQEVKTVAEAPEENDSEEMHRRQTRLNHTIDVLYESALVASGFPARRPHVLIHDLFTFMSTSAIASNETFRLQIPDQHYIEADEEIKAAQDAKRKQDQSDKNEESADEDFDFDDLDDLGIKHQFFGDDHDEL